MLPDSHLGSPAWSLSQSASCDDCARGPETVISSYQAPQMPLSRSPWQASASRLCFSVPISAQTSCARMSAPGAADAQSHKLIFIVEQTSTASRMSTFAFAWPLALRENGEALAVRSIDADGQRRRSGERASSVPPSVLLLRPVHQSEHLLCLSPSPQVPP